MKNLDTFGVRWKRGTNLDLLRKAQSYFAQEYGTSVLSYQYTTDSTKVRVLNSLVDKDLKTCSICKKNLYYFEEFEDSPNGIKVRQKKKLIFMDDLGKEHHCCYKFNSCLQSVGFGDINVVNDVSQRVPTFMDFLGITEDDIGDEHDYVEAAEKSYNECVSPFIQKWRMRPINKHCLFEFLDDLERIEAHMKYYENNGTRDKIANKIYRMIGIKL